MESPELQDAAFYAHCQINKKALKWYIQTYAGKRFNGIVITESGMLAAAHLGGARGVKLFLSSKGRVNRKDAYGTSISLYMDLFSEYDTSTVVPERKVKLN